MNIAKDYTVLEEGFLPEYQTYGTLLKHKQTGLEIYHLEAKKDREFFFVYTFATPATNSTGVAHILEHSVFSGSEKYPQRDPFLELLKKSTASFLNAFTDLDHTSYPAASPVRKDFNSLFSVYTDAIFFPLLRKETFMQEGVRLDMNKEGKLIFDGVVFNEMMGATSSQGGIAAREAVHSLLPNSCYAYNSGGDPKEIPNLTWEELRAYHKTWYTPANCKLMLYGNFSLEEALHMVEAELLERSDALREDLQEGSQAYQSSALATDPAGLQELLAKKDPITKPKVVEVTAPLDQGGSAKDKAMVILNWLTTPFTDKESLFALDILTEYLLGNPGAPLYKAIVQSNLGQDLYSGSGMTPEYGDLIFSVGIEGTNPEDREAIEQLILDQLQVLVDQGLDQEILQGALRKCEFHRKERKGGMPQGLRMHFRAIRGWLRGFSPTYTMLVEKTAAEVSQLVQNTPGYLESWVEKHLLTNVKRTTLVVTPHAEHSLRIQQHLDAKLKEKEQALTNESKAQLKQELQEFYAAVKKKDFQPLAIDLLCRNDIDAPPQDPPVEEFVKENRKIAYQEVPSQDIVYLSLYSDISTLTEEELRLLPLYGRMVTTSPLSPMSYDQVSRKLAHLMGSCYGSCDIHRVGESENYRGFWYLRSKLLAQDLAEALDFMGQLVAGVQVDNHDAIKRTVKEVKQEIVQDMVAHGDNYGAMRSGASFSLLLQWEELWDGVGYLETLQAIDLQCVESLEKVGKILLSIRNKLVSPCRIFVSGSSACKAETLATIQGWATSLPASSQERFFTTLPKAPSVLPSPSCCALQSLPLETIAISGQTAYSALVVPSDRIERGAALRVLGVILTAGDLWNKVRMKGGAYGVAARQRDDEGVFLFSSYRDPHPLKSLQVFLTACDEISALTEEDMEATIIKLFGSLLKPRVPAEQHSLFAARWIYGITPELRAKQLHRYHSLTLSSLAESAAFLRSCMAQGHASIVGNTTYLEKEGVAEPYIYEVDV